MGTDAVLPVKSSSLKVDFDGTSKLTVTLTIDNAIQKLKLGSASIVSDGTIKGISLTATVDATGSTSPNIVLPVATFPSGSSYDYVELSLVPTRKPNPRVIVKVSIP